MTILRNPDDTGHYEKKIMTQLLLLLYKERELIDTSTVDIFRYRTKNSDKPQNLNNMITFLTESR